MSRPILPISLVGTTGTGMEKGQEGFPSVFMTNHDLWLLGTSNMIRKLISNKATRRLTFGSEESTREIPPTLQWKSWYGSTMSTNTLSGQRKTLFMGYGERIGTYGMDGCTMDQLRGRSILSSIKETPGPLTMSTFMISSSIYGVKRTGWTEENTLSELKRAMKSWMERDLSLINTASKLTLD
jgi:hypothetical protein